LHRARAIWYSQRFLTLFGARYSFAHSDVFAAVRGLTSWMEMIMAHRRTSGAKVRSHKLGFNNSRFAKGKQARLQNRRIVSDAQRMTDPDMT
jgi:hypothetical protein